MRPSRWIARWILPLILQPVVVAQAGHVYGFFSEGGKPGPQVPIQVACAQRSYTASTLNDGSYRLLISEKGKWTFSVSYKGQSPSTAIFSYYDPVGYDFELVAQ